MVIKNTSSKLTQSICMLPRLSGLGGTASFQARMVQGLAERRIAVCYDPHDSQCAALLIVGGTRRLDLLLAARRRGIPVIQRLNGMNWIHRKVNTGIRHYLRAEQNNLILATIRRFLANRIVYQSRFSQNWWENVHGCLSKPARVVYNGVDLKNYNPDGLQDLPQTYYRILLLEGRYGGGYDSGLENGLRLVEILHHDYGLPVQLDVVGQVPDMLQTRLADRAAGLVNYLGILPRAQIPAIDRSAHLLFSVDLHAACPNSVIEALACGLPVVAFDTGGLPELVCDGAGIVVPYGSNPWQLESPDMPALAKAAFQILTQQEAYRSAARRVAEENFGLDQMVEGYLEVLLA